MIQAPDADPTERSGEPLVSSVIVNYRRYDLLAGCLTALLASSRPPDEIIVVDNESDPSQLKAIAASFPMVTLIANTDNGGFARACNQGWRTARGQFLAFINPDVTVDATCLERCLEAALEAPDIAIVTPRLVRPDGRLDHACHRGLPTPAASLAYLLRLHRVFPRSRRFARYTMGWLDERGVHDVEACSGAFMLVRRSALDAIGGWDERYWFYAEDLDVCLRVGRRGGRVRYLGTASAAHLKGASSHLRDDDSSLDPAARLHKRRIQHAIIDSHRLFFEEHYAAGSSRLVTAAVRAIFGLQRLGLRLRSWRDPRAA